MRFRVLVTATSFGKVSDRAKRLLESAGCDLLHNPYGRPYTEMELQEAVAGIDGIIAGVDHFSEAVMARADNLRVIARRGVGVDGVDLRAATKQGILVTNTPGANSKAVADLVLAVMLAVSRGLLSSVAALQGGRWVRPLGHELGGKTLGLLGLGRIGREVARRASGFGMRLLAHDPFWPAGEAKELGVSQASQDEVLREADYLSLHLPLTPETEGLIGEPQLRAMRKTAYLINTARGELVQEEVLVTALQENWIAGAALDVFRQEPPFGSPLLSLPNLLPTPHLASQTEEAVEAMDMGAAENLLAVLKGQRPPHLVNPDVWPKSV
ncbi:MAG: phosphoglycerate dehydrogenase [Bacillota bacterium]